MSDRSKMRGSRCANGSRGRARRRALVGAVGVLFETVEPRRLLAGLTITGSNAVDTLVVNAASFTLNGVTSPIDPSVTSLTLNVSGGTDTVTINATPVNRPVTINAGGGNDTINVGNGDLDSILSPVSVAGGFGGTENDLLVINHSADAVGGAAQSVDVRPGNVVIKGKTITRSNVARLSVLSSNNPDNVHVFGTAAGTSVTVNSGGGNDTLQVGDSDVDGVGDLLRNLKGKLTLDAGSGTDGLTLNHFSATTNDIFTLTDTLLKSTPVPAFGINLANLDSFNIKLSARNETFDASTVSKPITWSLGGGNDDIFGGLGSELIQAGGPQGVTVAGGGGNDTIIGSGVADVLFGDAGNDFITGGSGFDAIGGGAGNDTLSGDGAGDYYFFTPASVAETDFIADPGSGASSTGVLDFSAITTPVTINLAAVASDAVVATHANRTVRRLGTGSIFLNSAIGGSNNDSIVGNASANQLFGAGGDDTLVGADGADTLTGGTGSDSLLGQAGTDSLVGAEDDDVLNGGLDSDTLSGGVGTDSYVFDNALTVGEIDKVFDQAGEGDEDTLDFGAVTTSVTVTLNARTLALQGGRKVVAGIDDTLPEIELVNGGSGDDSIVGNGRQNALFGNGGNDTLRGGDEIDGIDGGAGNDQIFGDNGNDVVLFGAEGNDTIDGGQGNDVIDGSLDNDLLIGQVGDDTLLGNAGDDTLNGGEGNDSADGGAGNDRYLFGNGSGAEADKVVELSPAVVGPGSDTIDFSSLTTSVNVNLNGDTFAVGVFRTISTGAAGQVVNIENVIGGSTPDLIVGNSAANSLSGGGGNDTIKGGAGDDTIDGGADNDSLAGEGNNDKIFGGTGNDSLSGADGNDSLFDAEGNDTMAGGTQNDTYVFADTRTPDADVVTEFSGAGTDTLDFTFLTVGVSVQLTQDKLAVQSGGGRVVTATPGTGTNFENATGGSGDDEFVGNNGPNIFKGNGGADNFAGQGGNDTIFGDAGDDTIDGGDGSDSLVGGTDADTYFFVAAGATPEVDTLTEVPVGPSEPFGALDTLTFVQSLTPVVVNLSSDTLATQTNRTIKTGVAGSFINFEGVVGSQRSDSITGNAGTNLLQGSAGDDTISGGGGVDLISGDEGNDRLSGDAGNDTLIDGEGSDTLIGGADNDTYAFAAAVVTQTDVITELPGGGTDLLDFRQHTGAVVVNLSSDTLVTASKRTIKTGTAGTFVNIENVYGTDSADSITGNTAGNELDGGKGNDTIKGLSGADLLFGGDGDDRITADEGADTLEGGAGSDTLVGGVDDDTYRFGAAPTPETDTLTELASGGTDSLDFKSSSSAVVVILSSDVLASQTNRTVRTSAAGSFINFENVVGTGFGDFIFGNTKRNVIDGFVGNDTIDGGDGGDVLTGGTGNDLLLGGEGNDTLFGSDGTTDTLDGGNGVDSLGSSDASDVKLNIP